MITNPVIISLAISFFPKITTYVVNNERVAHYLEQLSGASLCRILIFFCQRQLRTTHIAHVIIA